MTLSARRVDHAHPAIKENHKMCLSNFIPLQCVGDRRTFGRHLLRAGVACVLLLALPFASNAEDGGRAKSAKVPVAGVDYEVLVTPIKTESRNRIEVIEVFNYACGHCNDFFGKLEAWQRQQPADVAISYVAAPYGGFFDEMARAFYAAQGLGVVGKTHEGIFRAVHVTKTIRAGDKPSIVAAYARLGVDPARFSAEYDGSRVDQRLNDAKKLMIATGVDGVPALIIAGHYRIDAGDHVTFEAMLETADYLIRLERTRPAAAKP
ncbi:thiol:disulfide interchange protein DsbA/DsbL [Xanthomonas arboricola pv. corylina]|uniref:thiol:disulfide interchange protein DsbA/DsbL n=1 Tax=Xanthomonas arboricola TaxID=56448 RepID=UPI0025B06DA0|nr:thiol:disulfide interchange protein DsbA/DsbL [Xanthomonas arboricola]MDN0205230.1 thiol:disulfide interchange protein DsbA/DsbL [Xanthomonas arboricola pv. corylina]MDN0218161.1 thiol:disulfide interchange protein DsbA/DsbL [Xanthomonas arboricola pv. corylina]MEB2125411.1 thiol:disulfide interchange protein DsbA/DsbL [Xanthomonas campestris pv. campestris]